MARYERTMHFVGNQLIELDGDAAHSETYAIAYHQLTEVGQPKLLVAAVRYLDEFARGADGWRIRRRTVIMEWQRTDPLMPMPGR